MGYAEDHEKVVAKRMSKRLQAGESEQSVRKYLAECYWTSHEIDCLMQRAKRYAEKGVSD